MSWCTVHGPRVSGVSAHCKIPHSDGQTTWVGYIEGSPASGILINRLDSTRALSYERVVHDIELLRYVLRCAIERQF